MLYLSDYDLSRGESIFRIAELKTSSVNVLPLLGSFRALNLNRQIVDNGSKLPIDVIQCLNVTRPKNGPAVKLHDRNL